MSIRGFLRDLSGFAGVNLARSVIPFVLMPILTAWLGPSGYGVLSLLEVTILIFTPLFLFNSTAIISTRYYQLDQAGARDLITASLALAAVVSLVAQLVLWAGGDLVRAALNLPDRFYLLLPAFILVRMITTYVTGIYQIQQRVALYGLYSVSMLVLDLGLSLLLVVELAWGYKGRLIGSHLAMLAASAVGLWHLHRTGLLGTHISRKCLADVLRFGSPLIPHALGGVALAMASRYLIGYFMTTADVGLYAAAYQMASVMLLAGTSINQVWSVTLFKLLSGGALANGRAIKKLLCLNIILVIGIAAGIYATRDILFLIFVAPAFKASMALFPWLLGAFLFQSLYFLFVNFDFHEESTMRIGAVTLMAAALNIGLNILWLPHYGLQGAAWAAFASMGVYFAAVTLRVVMFCGTFRTVLRA